MMVFETISLAVGAFSQIQWPMPRVAVTLACSCRAVG
jgi:hypothetical protein